MAKYKSASKIAKTVLIALISLTISLSIRDHCLAQTRPINNVITMDDFRTWQGYNSWGTYDTRSILTHVFLQDPEQHPSSLGLVIGLHKTAKNGELWLTEALIGRKNAGAEVVEPKHNSYSGIGMTDCYISWQGAKFRVSTSSLQSHLCVKVACITQPKLPVYVTIAKRNFWPNLAISKTATQAIYLKPIPKVQLAHNYPNGGDAQEVLIGEGQSITLEALVQPQISAINQPNQSPSWMSDDALRELFANVYKATEQDKASELTSPNSAISNTLSWNTIYDPTKRRLLTTVNRIWNVERGGYVVFCWDNFFGSILWAKVNNYQAAISNFCSTLDEVTPDGFVPNNSQGNGRAAWDRSQPPVGTLALAEILGTNPKPEILQVLKPQILKLVRWNDWWWQNRKNGALLSWGSKAGSVPNRFQDVAWNNRLAAALESGADDSPAYDDVPFDSTKGLLMLHDVALNSLYANDCALLIQYSIVLGMTDVAKRLKDRQEVIKSGLALLWDEKAGIYKNKHVTGKASTDTLSSVITPFNFLPLLAGVPNAQQAKRMVLGWMRHPQHFGGPYPLPSVDRQHPSYYQQQYWRGATWPPMNYLVWLGLKKYPNLAADAQWLGQASQDLFMGEYQRKGYIGENYSNITGTCDDGLVKAETYYFWGCLLGIMK